MRTVLPADENRTVYNLNVALGVVRDRLTALDIEEQSRLSDSRYESVNSASTVTVGYLGKPYVISFPELTVLPEGNADELPLRERILVLRYLAQAKGTTATNKLITYRDIPGGVVYFPTFSKRTTDQLTRRFGREPELLLEASRTLGGRVIDLGDTGVVINGFNRVPITLVLWHGDEELAPQLNMLFDTNITDYLESEDVTVLCEVLTWKLVRYSQKF
jgi:hypothetical protein